ncbi:MAG: hypothetical protein C5B52_18435, partial [Bacteroidetes bacterium]
MIIRFSKLWCLLLPTLFVFFSCEKNINIDLQTQTPKMVVEATIENGKPPLVLLSTSLDFYSEITPEILESSFVHGAHVEIGDGTKTFTLSEYTVDSGGVKISYYSIDTTNPGNAIVGKLNSAYSLKITANGQEYTSTTTI